MTKTKVFTCKLVWKTTSLRLWVEYCKTSVNADSSSNEVCSHRCQCTRHETGLLQHIV